MAAAILKSLQESSVASRSSHLENRSALRKFPTAVRIGTAFAFPTTAMKTSSKPSQAGRLLSAHRRTRPSLCFRSRTGGAYVFSQPSRNADTFSFLAGDSDSFRKRFLFPQLTSALSAA